MRLITIYKMEITTNKIFAILVALNLSLFAQSSNSDLVKRYKSFLTVYSIKLIDNEFEGKNISCDETKNIVYEINSAYQSDPELILKMKTNSYLDLLEECGNNKEKYLELRYKKLGAVESILIHSIESKISEQEFNLLKTQMILTGSIIDIEEKKEVTNDSFLPFMNIVYLTIKIEDIIKGNSRINIGDEVTVFYNKSWLEKNFEWVEDKRYLFELEFRSRRKNDYEIGLITYHSNSNGFYPIENNTIFDEDNYFGYGKIVNCDILKANLKSFLKR